MNLEEFIISEEEQQAWRTMIQAQRVALGAIIIPSDIDPALGKHVLSRLDSIYSEVRPIYGDISKQYVRLEEIMKSIRKKAAGAGSNANQREANSIRAVEEVRVGETQTINLYEIFYVLVGQKADLESLLDVINWKQSLIISASGLLKIEANLAGH